MITGWIIGLVVALLRPVFALLPTVDLSSISGSVVSGATTAGQWAGKMNGVFPVTETLNVAAFLATVLEAGIIAYLVANWIYRHIPQLGGFGPGSG